MHRLLMGGRGASPVRTPVRRAPLVFPTCGSCPDLYSYDKDLAAIWPTGVPQTRDYLRAWCWSIVVKGLPYLPGLTAIEQPAGERFLSYLFDSYPTWAQDHWLQENIARGATHVYLSWPNSRDQAGRTVAQFRESCQRVKAVVRYLHVKLTAKGLDPRDLTLADWRPRLDPVFDALAGIVDEYSPWEYDLHNQPGDEAVRIHRYLGQRAHDQGASFWCHFSPARVHWLSDGDDGGLRKWCDLLGDTFNGFDHQAHPSWDIGNVQERLVDLLNRLAEQGNRHKAREFEPGLPSVMFTEPHPNEGEADAFGYLTLCTKARAPVWGFGDGARMPDGSAI